MKYENWIIENNDNVIKIFLQFLTSEFEKLFKFNKKDLENCKIFIDSSSNYPMLITNSNPISIRLAVKNSTFFCQVIYQLSHELCHFYLRQNKNDKETTIKWFEETICEAVSLYMLDFCCKNWTKCELYSKNLNFAKDLEKYLKNLLEVPEERILNRISTQNELIAFNNTCEAERNKRIFERNLIYNRILEAKSEVCCIINYTKYSSIDNLLIDIEKLKQDYSNIKLVDMIDKFQPKIETVG